MPELSSVSVRNPKSYAMSNRVALLGDSITVNMYSFNVIASYYAGMVLVKNAGISGNTLVQMDARFESDLGSENFDILILHGGTNDVAGAITTSQSLNAVLSIYNKCKAKGITLVVVPPATRTDGFKANLLTLREAIKTLCFKNGIMCSDAFSTCIDHASGDWLASHSGDGIHPALIARQKASTIFGDYLKSIVVLNDALYPKVNVKGIGIFANPLMILDSNTDGYADGYYYGSIGTPTVVTDADFIGKAQHFSATGINNSFVTWRITPALGLVAGHRYLATMKIKITSFDSSYSFYSYVKGLNTNYAKSLMDSFQGDVLCRASIEYVAKEGDVDMIWVTGITKLAGSANCQISFGEMQFYDLDAY